MSFILIEGQIVNMMAVTLIRFQNQENEDWIEIFILGRPDPLTVENKGGLWDKLKAMASPLRSL